MGNFKYVLKWICFLLVFAIFFNVVKYGIIYFMQPIETDQEAARYSSLSAIGSVILFLIFFKLFKPKKKVVTKEINNNNPK